MALVFMFDGRFAFEFEFIFEFMFVGAGVIATVGAGVGVLRFTFVLFAVLLVAASPQAIPSVPSVRTAASAIFFIIPD